MRRFGSMSLRSRTITGLFLTGEADEAAGNARESHPAHPVVRVSQPRGSVSHLRLCELHNLAGPPCLALISPAFEVNKDLHKAQYSCNAFELDLQCPASQVLSMTSFLRVWNTWISRPQGLVCTNLSLQKVILRAYGFARGSSLGARVRYLKGCRECASQAAQPETP